MFRTRCGRDAGWRERPGTGPSPDEARRRAAAARFGTIAGQSNIAFRWDVFYLFNHPGFGFPNQNFDSATAGRITSTSVDNRSMQLSLKFNF